jgi:hypothetical protein
MTQSFAQTVGTLAYILIFGHDGVEGISGSISRPEVDPFKKEKDIQK